MGRRNKTQKLKKIKKQRKRQANTTQRDQVGNPGGDLQSTVEERGAAWAGEHRAGGQPQRGLAPAGRGLAHSQLDSKGMVAFLQAGHCCGSAGEA